MLKCLHFFLTACLLLSLRSHCYSPVVLMHGIFDGPETMSTIESQIEYAHPGTKVYKINMFNNEFSMDKMWYQVSEIQKKLKEIMSTSNSTHFLGFSQGGLIGRALIETTNDHNINTFIALSSPLSGEFGIPLIYYKWWPNATLKFLSDLFYSEVGQELSLGGYWHDPYDEALYRQKCEFLPKLTYPSNPDWKNNFLKLKKLVMIGGPNDEVIKPWQSSHFGFFNYKEEVVPMEQLDFYINDTFGLKTLDEQGRVFNFTIPNVFHTHWHEDINVIQKYIIPYLD